ncbi:MAG: TldD/PmbA family protein [Candidatus Thermoplasmatota archaeon]
MQGLVEEIVAKARMHGATDAIAILERSDAHQVKFANSEIAAVKSWLDTSLLIYFAAGQRVVSAVVSDLSRVDSVLSNLEKSAKSAPENKDFHGIAGGKFKYADVPMDKRIVSMEDRLTDLTWEGINAAEKEGAKRCAGVMHRYHHVRYMRSSQGLGYRDESAALAFSIRAFNDEGGAGHSVSCASNMDSFAPAEAGKEAGETCILARSPSLGEEGMHNVLLTHLSAADIALHTAAFASASRVDAGLSFLKDKIGAEIASPEFCLRDDGTIPGGLGSRCADDEGVPTQSTEIIKDGRLLSYLHNTSTAVKHDTSTTANAGLVHPRPWNVLVVPGEMRRAEILEEMGSGYLISNVWYTRFQNYLTGDYSTIPRDAMLRVKDGRIAGAVKGMRVSDNMERMLKHIVALGREQRQIYWWEIEIPTFVPEMLIRDVRISRSTM